MSERARDGALAFHRWFEWLMVGYTKVTDLTLGDPVPIGPDASE